ncbi:MAG: Do family serine endopeptidase [Pseudomonadota bacterium]|nr:Do family serine endopeptidase [Pseudomonadota bacterium]
MKLNPLAAALAGAGLALVGSAGALDVPHWFNGDRQVAATTQQSTSAERVVPAAPLQLAPGQTPNYRAIVKQSAPAVVGITVEGMHKASAEEQGGLPEGMDDDPFFKFFRGMPGFSQRGGRQSPQTTPFKGLGSGFIISADGLILTNAHVVREAKEVTVKLSDRREYTAKVLGVDPTTDIAVLRIPAKDLPVVRLGDPKGLEVGDPVLAIGAPYGLEQTATSGIVSAKGRSLPGDAVVPFIQTDAAVNPGNSGGPLFDGSGSVVGINSQIYSRSGGFQGLSFAIPIDVALKIKDQIVATGKVSHGRLGVAVQDLNQSLADSFGLKHVEGALVSNITPNSAAAAAGLKTGDVITAVNGEPVLRSGNLSSLIGMAAPGERVRLSVWRDRAERTIEAKLGGVPDSEKVADAGDTAPAGQLGLGLRPLTRQEMKEAKIDSGLVVENVGGPAERAGIQQGDVLLAINGKAVQSVDQLRKVLETKPKSVALLVQRDGEKIFVPVRLG